MPSIQETLNLIQDAKIEALFHQIYSHDNAIIQNHIKRYENLIKTFQSHFSNDAIHSIPKDLQILLSSNYTI